LDVVDASVPVTVSEGAGVWFGVSSKPGEYEIGEDVVSQRPGATTTAFLRSKQPSPGSVGSWNRRAPIRDLRGKRVRLSGWVEATDVRGWAGLWMRVEDPTGETATFDNMQDRPIRGTRGWTRYEVVLDVPTDAKGVSYGTQLFGAGSLRMADV